MNIVVYGTGYVGQVSGACLASKGNNVTLVDTNQNKVTMINNGKPTIVETGLPEIVSSTVVKGLLTARMPDDVPS
jgi:UDP-glucose 6-dehydrogenase